MDVAMVIMGDVKIPYSRMTSHKRKFVISFINYEDIAVLSLQVMFLPQRLG